MKRSALMLLSGLLLLIVLAGCGAAKSPSAAIRTTPTRTHSQTIGGSPQGETAGSTAATSATAAPQSSQATDPYSTVCDRDDPPSIRRVVTNDLTALENNGSPPSRNELLPAESVLQDEAALLEPLTATLANDVSKEAEALSEQLQGVTGIDVEDDLYFAVSSQTADAKALDAPGCAVAVPVSPSATGAADTGTDTTPQSSYRGPQCSQASSNGAVLPAPGCINQEGCRALTVSTGEISCANALSTANQAIQAFRNANETEADPTVDVGDYQCEMDPYEIDCSDSTTSFSTNYGYTGQTS
jgi:hypothetical protein